MTNRAARLFTRLQDADVYGDIHLTAANLLGSADQRSWLDVGSGPGVLTRIAFSALAEQMRIDVSSLAKV